ncbi:hypothetical protein GCM10009608_51960 [Pseudonocardia alaniniphila]
MVHEFPDARCRLDRVDRDRGDVRYVPVRGFDLGDIDAAAPELELKSRRIPGNTEEIGNQSTVRRVAENPRC